MDCCFHQTLSAATVTAVAVSVAAVVAMIVPTRVVSVVTGVSVHVAIPAISPGVAVAVGVTVSVALSIVTPVQRDCQQGGAPLRRRGVRPGGVRRRRQGALAPVTAPIQTALDALQTPARASCRPASAHTTTRALDASRPLVAAVSLPRETLRSASGPRVPRRRRGRVRPSSPGCRHAEVQQRVGGAGRRSVEAKARRPSADDPHVPLLTATCAFGDADAP